MGSTGFEPVLLVLTGFYWVLKVPDGFLLCSSLFYLLILVIFGLLHHFNRLEVGFYMVFLVSLSLIRFYWVLLGFYRALLDLTGSYWVLLGFTEFLLGFT